MSDYEYPFDPTGDASSNYIENEVHTIHSPDHFDHYFVVPYFAPFFRDNLKVIHYPSGKELEDGVDFVLSYKYVDASYQTARAIYGAISLYDTSLSGTLEISYQTLGGKWAIGEDKALEMLTEAIYNPRITSWEQVVDVPETFPIIEHEHDIDDMVGMKEVVDELEKVATAIGYSKKGEEEFYPARQQLLNGQRRGCKQWQRIAYAEYNPDDPRFGDIYAAMLIEGHQSRTTDIVAISTVTLTYDSDNEKWRLYQRDLTETEGAPVLMRTITDDDTDSGDEQSRVELWIALPENTGRYTITNLARETPFHFQLIDHYLVSGEPEDLKEPDQRGTIQDLDRLTSEFSSRFESAASQIRDIVNS